MDRIVVQLKKRLDKIDFRKVYKGFMKKKFLLLKDYTLYGLNKSYMLEDKEKGALSVIRDGAEFVVLPLDMYIHYNTTKVDYDTLLFELIVQMFKVYEKDVLKQEDTIKQKQIELLLQKKDYSYFEHKLEENLIMARILDGGNSYYNHYQVIHQKRMKESVTLLEEEIERKLGIIPYVRVQVAKIISETLYQKEMQNVLYILNDPVKVFELCKYENIFGCAKLLIDNIDKKNISEIMLSTPKTLIHFEELYNDYSERIRVNIMSKLTHAKKTKIKGKLVGCDIEYAIASNDLLYLPRFIEYKEDFEIKHRDGDFIIKVSDGIITEAYECLSFAKVLN